MDICISSRHSPSASDCMEGVSFFYPSLEMPLLWNRNSVPVFPCPELPFPFRSCFLGLANQLPGRHLFPCAFSSRTVFLFVLPIPKKQETYHPNRTAACCRLGYFFHFLFARIPLERSRYRPSQPCLHHGLYDTETSVFRKEMEALELCCSYRSSSCFSGCFSPSVLFKGIYSASDTSARSLERYLQQCTHPGITEPDSFCRRAVSLSGGADGLSDRRLVFCIPGTEKYFHCNQ